MHRLNTSIATVIHGRPIGRRSIGSPSHRPGYDRFGPNPGVRAAGGVAPSIGWASGAIAPPAAFGQRQGVQSAADGALRRGDSAPADGTADGSCEPSRRRCVSGASGRVVNQASNQVFARFGQTPLPAPAIGATHQQGGQRAVGFAQALQAGIHLTLGQP